MKNKIYLSTVVVFVLTLVVSFIKVLAYTDSYPYPNATHCGCQVDDWDFFKRQCTSYVAWKVNESGIAFSNNMIGPNGQRGQFANAGNWDDNALNIGFEANATPEVGSIAVWDPRPGYPYYMDVGHVAWVEQVSPSLVISEYNFNYGDGNYNVRTPGLNPDHYIHLNSSCGGQNIEINNKTVNGGQSFNCSATSNLTVKPESHFQLNSNVRLFIN